ncbi:MarR family transcriptional regulator [Herbidospora sp. NEAU-GS84]|uniref:MarR family transcriptional regulator n=1 Tax=Herbidospora solisilvae TaxID=2696284 RepID=A0A7C9J3B9_9ACTN|nr:MarR family winged helix-turn-helix transcriptional regulator [Herbidospora solisilvae]NAS23522.1 MarR family transcriptional regulator [Herbidospora solisilvae]
MAPRHASTFGWSMSVVLRRWQQFADETFKDLPHGARGFNLLSVVVHEEVRTQGALATRLAVDRTVLTYVIDDLEKAGLIERQPDPRDRRARRIVATEQGRKVQAEGEERMADAEEQVLGGLTEDQREVFRECADRAAEAIYNASPGADLCGP